MIKTKTILGYLDQSTDRPQHNLWGHRAHHTAVDQWSQGCAVGDPAHPRRPRGTANARPSPRHSSRQRLNGQVHDRRAEELELPRLQRLGEDVRGVVLGVDVAHADVAVLDALPQVVVAPFDVLRLLEGLRVVRQRDRRLVVDPSSAGAGTAPPRL